MALESTIKGVKLVSRCASRRMCTCCEELIQRNAPYYKMFTRSALCVACYEQWRDGPDKRLGDIPRSKVKPL